MVMPFPAAGRVLWIAGFQFFQDSGRESLVDKIIG
jgi:hypothetical protein